MSNSENTENRKTRGRPKGSKNKNKINLEQIEQDRASVGNTDKSTLADKKQGYQCNYWCFTLNNYLIEQIEQIEQILRHECRWYIFQEEMSESGTPHLQGTISLKVKQRLTALKKLNDKIHWEPTKSVTASVAYCSKEDTRNGNVYYYGFEPPIKYKVEIEQLHDWQLKIEQMIKLDPDDRSIYWYWENKGGIGKTTFQKYLFTNYEDVVILSGKGSDMKNGIVQYQSKNKRLPKIILINVPRSCHDYISYTGLEEVKDMMFFSGKYEGGMVCGKSPHLIVFANEEPDTSKMSSDRWKVIEIK